jgi:hypothetical protein
MLAFVDLEERVPPHHPLRTIKRFADRALAELSPTFDAMYRAAGGRAFPGTGLWGLNRMLRISEVIARKYAAHDLESSTARLRLVLQMSLGTVALATPPLPTS